MTPPPIFLFSAGSNLSETPKMAATSLAAPCTASHRCHTQYLHLWNLFSTKFAATLHLNRWDSVYYCCITKEKTKWGGERRMVQEKDSRPQLDDVHWWQRWTCRSFKAGVARCPSAKHCKKEANSPLQKKRERERTKPPSVAKCSDLI